MAASVGVKVTPWFAVPALGAVDGVVKAKVPGKDAPPTPVAAPPVRLELTNVCPRMIELAVGWVAIVEVALLTVTLTSVVTVLKLFVAVGVKVTLWLFVPALGAVEGLVKAEDPSTLPTPFVSVLLASVCPYVIGVAVGADVIVGAALLTVTLTPVLAVL